MDAHPLLNTALYSALQHLHLCKPNPDAGSVYTHLTDGAVKDKRVEDVPAGCGLSLDIFYARDWVPIPLLSASYFGVQGQME